MYFYLNVYKIVLQRHQCSFCALLQTAPMLPLEKCVTIGKIMTIKSYELPLMKCTDRFLWSVDCVWLQESDRQTKKRKPERKSIPVNRKSAIQKR